MTTPLLQLSGDTLVVYDSYMSVPRVERWDGRTTTILKEFHQWPRVSRSGVAINTEWVSTLRKTRKSWPRLLNVRVLHQLLHILAKMHGHAQCKTPSE